MKKKSVYVIWGVIAIILVIALVIAINRNELLKSSKNSSEHISTDNTVKTSVGDSESDNVEKQSGNIADDTTDLKNNTSVGKSNDVSKDNDNTVNSENSEKATKKKDSKSTDKNGDIESETEKYFYNNHGKPPEIK